MNIFKKKTSPKEALRTSKREMTVATRGIEREIASLQLEEKKLVAEIKLTAKTGNEASLLNAATKILARQLVRLRQQITNLQGSRAQIRGVATHTQALYASTSISTGMKGATKAMVAMNKQMAPAKQAKVIKEFQMQSAKMDMTIEMMSEAIDETLDKDEAEEETEELTNQVLDEIGVDIASQLSSAPKGRIASKNAPNTVSREEEEDRQREMQSQVVCRGCTSVLLYPSGATNMANVRIPLPANRPNGIGGTAPSTSMSLPHSQTQTVVVENPMSVDESGKLVSSVVVGVTTEKK
ncbi:hypothetical protein NC651_004326 [Populus alba x Populus x berolinensis]|nr:hypothetical protein NC651_004326 [Populus alba x Populus x berolinensis]